MKKIFVTALISAITSMLFSLGFTWLITCGFIKLIAYCFGAHVSWRIATGVWLIIVALSTFKEAFFKNK